MAYIPSNILESINILKIITVNTIYTISSKTLCIQELYTVSKLIFMSSRKICELWSNIILKKSYRRLKNVFFIEKLISLEGDKYKSNLIKNY